jgi:hypothetical protein
LAIISAESGAVISPSTLIRCGPAAATRQPVIQIVYAIANCPSTEADKNRRLASKPSFRDGAFAKAGVRGGLGSPKNLDREHCSQHHLAPGHPRLVLAELQSSDYLFAVVVLRGKPPFLRGVKAVLSPLILIPTAVKPSQVRFNVFQAPLACHALDEKPRLGKIAR